MRRFYILLASALAALWLLAGCSGASAEDFYALPQLSDQYIQLQSRIDEILGSGAEFSAPTSGSNRQAVQLEDVDGDGVKEAVVFVSIAGSTKPQKIVIFRTTGDGYEEVARIEGEGAGIDSISYIEMDGSGAKEIAVGWRIASGMNMLSVYTMRDFTATNILNTDYSKFVPCDLDGDGASELIVLRLAQEGGSEAEAYSLGADGEMTSEVAPLSADIRSLSRVRTGLIMGGVPMLLVEGSYGTSGIITDIFAMKNGVFANVTLDPVSGVSGTARQSQVWSRDINGDGVMDVPQLMELPAQPGASTYYLTRWYDYRTTGRATLTATTFTNSADEWYLRIPNDWIGRFTVRRQDVLAGERAVIFSYTGRGLDEAEDFLAIYTLSGDNREERAVSGTRFPLSREEDRVYAADILSDDPAPVNVTQEIVMNNFYRLYSEWITSDT